MIGSADCRDLAIFTIAQDEPELIHPWVNHYKNHVSDAGDIYILVHPPTDADGALIHIAKMREWQLALTLLSKHHGVICVPVHHASAFDHQWLCETVQRFQSFLLQSYGWVLFAEIDEFVLPTPGPLNVRKTLHDYVGELGASAVPAIRAMGFEVVQQEGEPMLPQDKYNTGANMALTAGELIVDRHWWRPSDRYSKTLLGRVPLRWGMGFHTIEGMGSEIATAEPSDALTLVHLHKVDFELALARVRRSRSRKWSKFDVEVDHGRQNRLATPAELRAFWELDIDTLKPAEASRLLPIADGVKEALR